MLNVQGASGDPIEMNPLETSALKINMANEKIGAQG